MTTVNKKMSDYNVGGKKATCCSFEQLVNKIMLFYSLFFAVWIIISIFAMKTFNI